MLLKKTDFVIITLCTHENLQLDCTFRSPYSASSSTAYFFYRNSCLALPLLMKEKKNTVSNTIKPSYPPQTYQDIGGMICLSNA